MQACKRSRALSTRASRSSPSARAPLSPQETEPQKDKSRPSTAGGQEPESQQTSMLLNNSSASEKRAQYSPSASPPTLKGIRTLCQQGRTPGREHGCHLRAPSKAQIPKQSAPQGSPTPPHGIAQQAPEHGGPSVGHTASPAQTLKKHAWSAPLGGREGQATKTLVTVN